MRSSNAIILALVFGMLTLGVIYFMSNGNSKSEGEVAKQPEVQLGSVVVVTQDVAARTVITEEMLEIQQVPAEYIHPMAVVTTEEAVDMISLVPISAGEQLLKTKIADPDTNYLSYKIREGYVAYSVPISPVTAVGGMIRVGDEVHVVGQFGAEVAGEEQVKFFLQDLPVIAMAKDMALNAVEGEEDGAGHMTLEVTPEQATQLAWAQKHGSLTFVLKSVLDLDGTESIESVTSKTFFGDNEAYQDKEYLDTLKSVSELRKAETDLLDYGYGDVQQIRKKLDFDHFYYDDLNPDSNSTK